MVLAVAEAALIVAVGVQAADRVKGSPTGLRQGQVWGCVPGRKERRRKLAAVRPLLGALHRGCRARARGNRVQAGGLGGGVALR